MLLNPFLDSVYHKFVILFATSQTKDLNSKPTWLALNFQGSNLDELDGNFRHIVDLR